MFAYIIGDVDYIDDDHVVLDNNGIGYIIFCSDKCLSKLEIGDSVKIYTEYITRDDGTYLYGFLDEDEKRTFKYLTGVTSIGPKMALGILSSLSPSQIKLAVLNNDIEGLTRAPGVGKKTASRIVLELLDKMKKWEDLSLSEGAIGEANSESKTALADTAIGALINLGYQKREVEKIVLKHLDEDSLEEIVRKSLRDLAE